MAIIGTLPNNIANGQAVDANPVMADFNFIVNQVNANANPLGTLTAPSGTRMAFQQIAAPLGWTVDITSALSNSFLRCVTPANFAGTGGATVATQLILGGAISTDPTTLTLAQIPGHNHTLTDPGHVHTVNDPGHSHPVPFNSTTPNGGPTAFQGNLNQNTTANTNTATTNISLNSTTTGITVNNNGGGGSHTHTITPNCMFVDQIIAVKS